MKLEYFSTITDGKMQRNTSQLIAEEIKHFEGKRVHITIEKLKSTRSVQQNRLWWLYIGIIAKEIGYTKDELHEICKFKFLRKEKVNEKTGEVFEYCGSTAKLGKSEFGELVDKTIQWASESFNIILPAPGDQSEMDL